MPTMSSEVYFDNNATTPCLDAVIAAVSDALGTNFGNPSSAHCRGYMRQEALGVARAFVEDVLGAPAGSAVFTSGGTEANNLVVLGVLRQAQARTRGPLRLITSPVEHSSVTRVADALATQGVTVDYLPVGSDGVVCTDELESLLARPAALVSLQWANSETGVMQPIDRVAAICRDAGTPLHCDAAQAVGKLPIDLSTLPIGYLTFTGHKLHAPPGIGVVIDTDHRLGRSLWYGGDQERGIRPGTQNLAAIIGLREALAIRYADLDAYVDHLRTLRDRFERLILQRIPTANVNGRDSPRVCNTSNVCFPGIEGQALVAQMSRRGVCCSQTSACTSHVPRPSSALLAMGLSEADAFASVRFSFSVLNTDAEVQAVGDLLSEVYSGLLRLSAQSVLS